MNQNQVVFVINMTSFGHPEDGFSESVIRYAGPEKSASNDSNIPLAKILLLRNKTNYKAYHIRFVKVLRPRTTIDEINKAIINNRPLYEFENLGPVQQLELPTEYSVKLEYKAYALLRYGLTCNYKTIERCILPCTVSATPPPLGSLLMYFKRKELIRGYKF
jgi:hypothetical protein